MMKLLFSLAIVASLGGCAIAPTHPSLNGSALPALIPIHDFVANTESTGGYAVSPDGKKLAWIGSQGNSPALWVKTIGQNDAKAFVKRPRYYRWSADSQYIALVADQGGDEDNHIFVARVAGADTKLVDLTPFSKTKSDILQVVQGGSDIIITSNQRDKKVFDVYKLDLSTGKTAPMAVNTGSVGWWGVDKAGQLRARVMVEGDASLLQIPQADATWKTTAQWSRFDTLYPIDFDKSDQSAWVLSNRGRDKIALVKIQLATGLETVVHAVPEVDVDRVYISKNTHLPLMVHSMPGYPQQDMLDTSMRARFETFLGLTGGQQADVRVSSSDDSERNFTVVLATDKGTKNYLLSDQSSEPEFLGSSSISRLRGLSDMKPISFTSRDGLQLNGYLTLPKGIDAKNLPMVLFVHGGPWARDRWSENVFAQFLSNRGYAVLQVNYRGSSGYGRAFQEKAIGEFAGKMHDDLVDGVQWAVKTGVADPAKVAIFGGSYGGYAAMVGATFTPEAFACSVNQVGVTDLARLLETVPPYWELGLPWWRRYVGDPAKPEDRAVMNAKSPLYKADKATRPILIMHGINDPRVKLEQSEMMVAALQKAGKQVDYVTFQGDGHGNQKWNNRLTLLRKTEDFLATCLGGRSSGFDYYQLAAWAF